MAHITIMGKDFPLEYTVEVMENITKKYGSSTKATETLNSEDGATKLSDTIWMLSEMMRGAEHRERVRCSLFGEEFTGTPALTYEQLRQVMNTQDLQNMANAIEQSFIEAGVRTTEIVEDPKNSKTMQ